MHEVSQIFLAAIPGQEKQLEEAKAALVVREAAVAAKDIAPSAILLGMHLGSSMSDQRW